MCKFNLIEAISNSIDPAGWTDQKQPPSQQSWEFPVLPPIPDYFDPAALPIIDGADNTLPDDLQDIFLDYEPILSPALPGGDQANHIIDDLLTDAATSGDSLFDSVSSPASSPFNMETPSSPLSDLDPPKTCGEVTQLLPPPPPTADGQRPADQQPLEPLLSAAMAESQQLPPQAPDPRLPPHQMVLDPWSPSAPSIDMAMSPPCSSDESNSVMTGPPWSPIGPSSPARRRQTRPPKPYDKLTRRQISEEERKQRKKEQNKTAATRYRRKKKEEQEGSSMGLDVLELRNKNLKENVYTLTRELSYLKHLMKEVMKYKRGASN